MTAAARSGGARLRGVIGPPKAWRKAPAARPSRPPAVRPSRPPRSLAVAGPDLPRGLRTTACHDRAERRERREVRDRRRGLPGSGAGQPGRLALIDRLAALIAGTPDELLPTVCYLCQGLIAPEFAGVDLGLAEKLASVRSPPPPACRPSRSLAAVRETGDLGQAAEQLLGATAADRPASLQVAVVVDTLHEIAARRGAGLAGPQAGAARRPAGPRPRRWRPATCCAWSPASCGWGSARPPSWTRSRRCTPVAEAPGRCWSGPTTSAATSAWSPRPWPTAGWRRSRSSRCAPATRCGPMLAQRLSDAGEILAKLGGQCAAEYKYDGVRVQAHRTADGQIELFTRRLERVGHPVPGRGRGAAGRPGPRRGDPRG